MIGTNYAFVFLRNHKNVEPTVEELVCKKSRGRINEQDMLTCFENGIGGQYGKIYSLDAATLLSWIDKFIDSRNKSANYLDAGLLDHNIKITDYLKYPGNTEDWIKEANKCYTAFLNGVKESNFHPHVYDRMMLDGKIKMNAYMEKIELCIQDEQSRIKDAKQKVLAEIFKRYRQMDFKYVYFIAPNS